MTARRLVVFGITGRMGQSLVRALREETPLRLSGAVASAASSRLGRDAAEQGEPTGVAITADAASALAQAAVAIDFSFSEAVAGHVQACAEAQVPVLVGATGLDKATYATLKAASERIAILVAANTSVGIGVLSQLVALATRGLGEAYDIEISETHHRLKRDAPSGTALALGEVAAQARGTTLTDVACFERHGRVTPRVPGSIGFSSLRAGDVVGEHTVTFATAGERIEITHRATDRSAFARGALRAAEWLIDRPAGLYSMQDVLGV